MASTVIIAVLTLCFLGYGDCRQTSAIFDEHEYQMNLEKRLQILNKPSIKTIIMKESGDVFDCVFLNQQPSFDHPALKNHKVHLHPTILPLSKPASGGTTVKLRGIREACPDGTVPIKRTTKEELIQMDNELLAANDQEAPSKRANIRLENHGKMFGSYSRMALYNLSIANDQESSTLTRLEAGPPGQTDVLSTGWKVSHSLNGDGFTRLFGYWHDGTNNKGCYNTLCPGFVQVDKEVSINYVFTQTSVTGDYKQQYGVHLALFRDPDTGNWWLYGGDDSVHIGYWPKELFPSLSNGADLITWGGATSPGANGDYPPMGNGQLPKDFYMTTCFFDTVRYLSSANEILKPKKSDTIISVDSSDCYALKFLVPNETLIVQGFSFMFGGPGGKCT